MLHIQFYVGKKKAITFYFLFYWFVFVHVEVGLGGYNHPFSAQSRATNRIEHGSSNSEAGPSKGLLSWCDLATINCELKLRVMERNSCYGKPKTGSAPWATSAWENQWSPSDVFTYTYACLSYPQIIHTPTYKTAILNCYYFKMNLNFCCKFPFQLQGTLHWSWWTIAFRNPI